jgi:thiamine pyrophosphate-dependent acetolactate synthase large subunit-like protein
MPVKNKIVQIDIKPENLGRRAKLDLGLCGDVKDTLQALMPYDRNEGRCHFSRSAIGSFIKKSKRNY